MRAETRARKGTVAPALMVPTAGHYLARMSAKANRKAHPESHLIEQRIATNPARAWDGCVHIASDAGMFEVPGTWHLELPKAASPKAAPQTTVPLSAHHGSGPARRALPLPLPAVGDHDAWRAHLRQVVTLRVAGTRLHVRSAEALDWRTLELAVPTAPASVVQIDRHGLEQLLGPGATLRMAITAASGR